MVTEKENRAPSIDNISVLLSASPKFPKTAIMATIGPKSFDPANRINLLDEMIEAGMNVVRINLAHVTDDKTKARVVALLEVLERAVENSGQPIIVTVDLGGPKIRVGKVGPEGKEGIEFKKGQELTLTLDKNFNIDKHDPDKDGRKFALRTDGIRFPITKLKRDQVVTMVDGCFKLSVVRCEGKDIVLRAENNWTLERDKGVNFPGFTITENALTRKDMDDLDWLFDEDRGVARDKIGYVSLSFVKKAMDVSILKNLLEAKYGQGHVRVISKIETLEAVEGYQSGDYETFASILNVSDGIMIARGDLGAEVPFEDVPAIQRDLIEKTHEARKPVIVATQMLEHMVDYEFATRAEVTDVTNAILEGADVTMLSAETSTGVNPVAAIRTMKTVAEKALERVRFLAREDRRRKHEKGLKAMDTPPGFVRAMAHPVVEFADSLGASLIVSFTDSGDTPIEIAHYRPQQPILAVTYNRSAVARLGLYRGIYTVYINYIPRSPMEHRDVFECLLEQEELSDWRELMKSEDVVVVTLSMEKKAEHERKTNALYVFRVGQK